MESNTLLLQQVWLRNATAVLLHFDLAGNRDLVWMDSLLAIFNAQQGSSNTLDLVYIANNTHLCVNLGTWWVSQAGSYIEYPFAHV